MSKEYIRVIFYNIQDIYDEVKRFYKDLVDCREDVEAIARTFEDHVRNDTFRWMTLNKYSF